MPAIPGNDATNSTVYNLDGTSVIRTDPYITTQGLEDAGRIYRGGTASNPTTAASPDGLPGNYLLGAATPSAFDQQVNFDARFGTVGDIGAFRFTQLALLGTPASISTASGPTNLALIADGGITDSSATTANTRPVIALDGLGNVLLATRDGAITFNQGVTFQNTDGTAPNLTLYARGGALDLENTTRFALGGALNLFSDAGVTLNAQAGTASMAGAGTVNVVSGGALAVGGTVFSNGNFIAGTTTAGGATPGGDFTLASGAAFGSISGTAVVSASGAITLNGMVMAGGALQFNAGGNLSTGAASILQGTGGATLSSTGAMTLGGTLTAAGNVMLVSTGDMNLNGPITLSAGLFSVQSTGAVNITGAVAGNPTIGSIDGSVAGGLFSVQGTSITVAAGASVSAGGDIRHVSSLVATSDLVINGRVDDGGGRLQLSAGGALTVGPTASILSNYAIVTSQGAVTLDLARFQKGDTSRSDRVSITGGSVSLNDSAGAYAIGSVDVTSTGAVSLNGGSFNFTSLQTTNADTAANPGNLTIAPGTTAAPASLILGGDLNVGNGAKLYLSSESTQDRVGGNVNLSGSAFLFLEQPLAVAGSVQVGNASSDAPTVVVGSNPGLSVAGNVNLGAGSVDSAAGTAINVGGTFSATGSVRVDTLNVAGNLVVGSLRVQTLTSNKFDGSANPSNPLAIVTGVVTPFLPASTDTFDLGKFGASGGLLFSGSTAVGGSLDAASLTLNVRGGVVFEPDTTVGHSVATAHFDGSASTLTAAAPSAGSGGTLVVTTSPLGIGHPEAVTGTISFESTTGAGPSPSPGPTPTLTALGGNATRGSSGGGGSGGAGGTLSFTSKYLSIIEGAILDTSGGSFTDGSNPATPTGTTAATGGAGGSITLDTTAALELTGTNSTILLRAAGGAVDTATTATASPGAGGTVSFSSATTLNATNVEFLASGGDVTAGSGAGGNGGKISLVGNTLVSLQNCGVTAATGVNGAGTSDGGTGGQITITATNTSNGSANGSADVLLSGVNAVTGNDASTSSTATTAQGGTISVTSARTGGPGILVNGSSELLALVNASSQGAGGSVTVQTNGANIEVDSATIRASGTGSQVLLNTANNAPAQASQITLTDATLSADVLKVQALGLNGTLTVGGSSTLSGSTQLLLYAGTGSGAGSLIEFVANTTLNSNAAGVLAAYTIKIDNGVQVSVTGPAVNLYATSLQFTGSGGDGSTSGAFTGSGATKAGNYGDPGTPAPAAAGANSQPSATVATTGVRRAVPAGGGGRPRTLPFEAVQPYLVRGGPPLPAHLDVPTSTRKVPASPAAREQTQPARGEVSRPGNGLRP